MNNSLNEIVKCIICNSYKWNYYNDRRHNVQIKCDYDTLFCNECKSFILNYLQCGGKASLEHIGLFDQLSMNRLQHTLSCFFLGIHFYYSIQSLQNTINSLMSSIREYSNNEDAQDRFKYIWMLMCLFHDIGYGIEEKKVKIDKKEINKIIKDYLSEKSGNKQYYVYSKNTIKSYDQYRQMKFGLCDHGIIGGALLYKDLCKLRANKELYGDDGLYWGEELKLDFYFAARNIVGHNIYKVAPNDNAEFYYRLCGLHRLINADRIIRLNKNPLLYLLCLVDTLEPVKLFNDTSILDNIEIEIKANTITIDASKLPDEMRCDYLGRIVYLNNWLTDVRIVNNNCVELMID